MILTLISMGLATIITILLLLLVVKNTWGVILVLSIYGILITTILLINNYSSKRTRDKFKFKSGKLNIYDTPLQKCEPVDSNHRSGSAMSDYTCSEIGGGFHQICVKNIGKGKSFSGNTGQSDWSKSRGGKSHCACLGAWANYVAATKNDKTLKCESIPDSALDPKYVKHWKSWNNVTLTGQAQQGLKELYKQCKSQSNGNKKKLAALNKKFCKLQKLKVIQGGDYC